MPLSPTATTGTAEDTIYLCNFRVSVDGDWLCLKELADGNMELSEALSSPDYDERDPAVIERGNLISISKLVVKEVIETSLKHGRMLDSDSVPLQHFFIVLEHVLRHGLRPKKGLLGPKKELWDLLQVVEKYCPEAQDITTSVRELPTVSTALGRARAWIRLALMQKTLADYFKVLLDHRDEMLDEYYEPSALMLSDDAIIIMGMLLGLNVVDCNICLKQEDLDTQQGVIDFSLYLRSPSLPFPPSSPSPLEDFESPLPAPPSDMTTVLDQKNYIEELNRHLTATVSNLQSKVENLQTTNALMKEDLAIAKNNLLSMQQDNDDVKKTSANNTPSDTDNEGSNVTDNKIEESNERKISSLTDQLNEEKRLRAEAEKELNMQVEMRAEIEMAMKLLEKDMHEKQDTIVSLRRQLDDIKLINLEMYKKLQECEEELNEKGEMITKLQERTVKIAETLSKLETSS